MSELQNPPKPPTKQKPIKIRHNVFAKPNKKWYQIWKKPEEYGKRIKFTKEQIIEAKALLDSGKEPIIKVYNENYESIPEPETIEPVLLLMKENGYADLLENIKAGEFIIKTPKAEKSIWLGPDKLTSIHVMGRYYRGWIAYENCMTPYPEEPMYSSELFRKITQKIAINYRDLNEANIITAKTKMWLGIIGAIVIGLVLLFSTDFGQQLMSGLGSSAPAVIETITTNLTAPTTATGNPGVVIQ